MGVHFAKRSRCICTSRPSSRQGDASCLPCWGGWRRRLAGRRRRGAASALRVRFPGEVDDEADKDLVAAEKALDHEGGSERAAAWRSLGRLGARGFKAASKAPRSLAALADADPSVRSSACRALGRIAEAVAAAGQAERSQSGAEPGQAESGAEAAQAKGCSAEASQSEDGTSASIAVNGDACGASGFCRGPHVAFDVAITTALAACLLDAVLDVRLAAGIATAKLADGPTLVAALLADDSVFGEAASVGDDCAAAGQVEVLKSVGRMGKAAARHAESLAAIARDGLRSADVRSAALAALLAIAPLAAVGPLAKALREDASPTVRLTAMQALAQVSSEDASAKGVSPRAEAASAASAAALEDADWGVRRAAVKALAAFGSDGVAHVASLRSALRDEDPDVRIAAADAIGQMAARDGCDAQAAAVAALLDAEAGKLEEDPRVRAAAARALSKMPSRTYDGVVERCLLDADEEVRAWVVICLGSMATMTPDDQLVGRSRRIAHLIRGDPDPSVRKVAIVALRRCGEPGEVYVAQVVAALQEDADSEVRAQAAESLGEIVHAATGCERALGCGAAELSVALIRDSCRYVRVAAAVALQKLGADIGTASAAALATALRHDGALGVRVAAAKALGAAGDVGRAEAAALADVLAPGGRAAGSQVASSQLAGDKRRGSTGRCQDVPDVETRRVLADVLGEMGTAGASCGAALAAALLHDASENVRYCAAWSLGELGGEELLGDEAVEAASKALLDSDDDVRDAAARALGLMGARALQHVGALALSLRDDVVDVRLAASKAFKALGPLLAEALENNAELAEALGAVLKKEDEVASLRANAARALGSLGLAGHSYAEAIAKLLSHEEVELRTAAVLSLGDMGPAGVKQASAVARAVKDEDSGVRAFALEALESMGPAAIACAPAVAAALHDDAADVRMQAAQALGALCAESGSLWDAEVTAALVQSLGDGDSGVRAAAARSLGRAGVANTKACSSKLVELRDNGAEDSDVREAAEGALRLKQH